MNRPDRSARRHQLGLPWPDVGWAAIDVETTGLDIHGDDIISVGVVPISGGDIDADQTFYTLVRPHKLPDPGSVEIHGIRPADLLGAPTAHVVATQLHTVIGDRLLIAHAAWMEQAFLHRLARRARTRLPAPIVDTAALCRCAGLVADTGIEPSLELMAHKLSVPVYTPHHALGDAMTTAVVFLALIARLGPNADGTQPLTVGSLRRLSQPAPPDT